MQKVELIRDAVGEWSYHIPVLAREVLQWMAPEPGKRILDGTLGGGGHSQILLRAGAEVIGLDQDAEALKFAAERLQVFADRLVTVQSNFRDFDQVLTNLAPHGLDGILVDLGVSSHQLDAAERGFSFRHDGPLDMRMNPEVGSSAADFVNESSEEELIRVLWEYGEVKQSRRVARAIVQRRESQPFYRTLELAECIASVLPRFGKVHPATQSFQALRIAVNDELGALQDLLAKAPHWLKVGGRLGVISFHSLEDRMVKRTLQKYSTPWLDRPEWPEPRPNPEYCMRLLHRKTLEAAEDEVMVNPRSRTARLRVAERIKFD